MIQVTPHMRIVVAVKPVDFRNGIDGLVRICKEVLKENRGSGLENFILLPFLNLAL
jgi:transposase